MKIPVTLSFFFFFTFSLKTLWAQKLPEKQKVLKDMLLAYEYFMIMLLIKSNFLHGVYTTETLPGMPAIRVVDEYENQ